jgi:hypothetical protein
VVTGIVVGRHAMVIRGSEFRNSSELEIPAVFPVNRVDIAVTSVFKGDVNDRLELTEIGCCVCEYQFEVGREYLIFVHPHWDMPGRLMASFCWPTKPTDIAARDLLSLGNPLRTYPPRTEVRSRSRQALDHAHALAVFALRRYPGMPATLRERKAEIVWSAATIGLGLALLTVCVRGHRAGPRI